MPALIRLRHVHTGHCVEVPPQAVPFFPDYTPADPPGHSPRRAGRAGRKDATNGR